MRWGIIHSPVLDAGIKISYQYAWFVLCEYFEKRCEAFCFYDA